MKKVHRVCESLPVGMMLCVIGGCLDADSFLLHGHVFAGLQTGNLVLLGAGYSQLNKFQILKYLAAITSFICGLILTRIFQDHDRKIKRSFSLDAVIIEMTLLLAAVLSSAIVSDYTMIAIMSFVSGVQLQAFPRINGHPFTPLMMMGHMKKTVNFMDKGDHPRVIANVSSLVSFWIGAIVTGLLIPVLGDKSLLFAVVMLVLILLDSAFIK